MTLLKPLLTMKHWQWFIALIGGIMVFEIIFFTSLFSSADSTGEPDPEVFRSLMLIMPILVLYAMYFSYGWQWGIISVLRDKLPAGTNMNHRRIKIFFIIPTFYLIFIMCGMFIGMYFAFEDIDATDRYLKSDAAAATIGLLMVVWSFIHLFSIFCIFHTMYFAAKTLKTVELQKEVKFNDFAAEFFLIWFNVIGIWILQPRLNKIMKGEGMGNNDADILDGVGDEEIV